jgi:hypothetical protein
VLEIARWSIRDIHISLWVYPVYSYSYVTYCTCQYADMMDSIAYSLFLSMQYPQTFSQMCWGIVYPILIVISPLTPWGYFWVWHQWVQIALPWHQYTSADLLILFGSFSLTIPQSWGTILVCPCLLGQPAMAKQSTKGEWTDAIAKTQESCWQSARNAKWCGVMCCERPRASNQSLGPLGLARRAWPNRYYKVETKCG